MKYLIILFLLCNSFLQAQILEINGKVIDSETGNPLPGANLYIKENPIIGISTDSLGDFSFKYNFKDNEHLVVSFIGYYTKTISISDIPDSR